MNKFRQLVRNSIRTPDGTILISRHRHDFVVYLDKNGKEYMVDGGLEYARRSAHGDEEELYVYTDDPFEKAREAFERGSRGKSGKKPLRWIPLANLSDKHLDNIIEYIGRNNSNTELAKLYKKEKEYRSRNHISIKEG